MKKIFTLQKLTAGTIFLPIIMNFGCAGGGGSDSHDNGPRPSVQTPVSDLTQNQKFQSPEVQELLSRLENINRHAGLPLAAKKSLSALVVGQVAEKTNIAQSEIVKYLLAKAGYSTEAQVDLIEKIQFKKEKLSNQVVAELGIPKISQSKVSYVSDSAEIKALLLNSSQMSLLNVIRRKTYEETTVVFKAIEEASVTSARTLLAAGLQKMTQDQIQQLGTLKNLPDSQANIEATKIIYPGLKSANVLNDSELSALTLYKIAEQAVKDVKSDVLQGTLQMRVTNNDVRQAAGALSQVVGALSEYAGDQKTKLTSVAQQLNQFSKNGQVKTDWLKMSADEKERFEKLTSDISGVLSGADRLLSIAEKFGVQSDKLVEIRRGIQTGTAVVSLVKAVATGNPLQVLQLADQLFSGPNMSAFGDPGLALQAEMNAKLDTIINLQKMTLNEIYKLQGQVLEVKKEILTTQNMIAQLSRQIVESNIVLYTELKRIEEKIDQANEGIKNVELNKFQSCNKSFKLEEKKNYLAVGKQIFSKNSLDKKGLLDCSVAFDSLNLLSQESLTAVKLADSSDTIFKLASINKNLVKYSSFIEQGRMIPDESTWEVLLNPIQKLYDYNSIKPISMSNFLQQKANENYETTFGSNEALVHSFRLLFSNNLTLDSQTVVKLALLYTKTLGSQYLISTTEDTGSDLKSALNVLNENAQAKTESLVHLIQIVNASIMQESHLSGMSSLYLFRKDNPVTNQWTKSEIDMSQPHDSRELKSSAANIANNANPTEPCNAETMSTKFCLFYADKTGELKTNSLKYIMNAHFGNEAVLNMLSPLKQEKKFITYLNLAFPDWFFTAENYHYYSEMGRSRVELPSQEEILTAEITYTAQLKNLIAVRELLVEKLVEIRLSSIGDEEINTAVYAESLMF